MIKIMFVCHGNICHLPMAENEEIDAFTDFTAKFLHKFDISC